VCEMYQKRRCEDIANENFILVINEHNILKVLIVCLYCVFSRLYLCSNYNSCKFDILLRSLNYHTSRWKGQR
jgi:hypothetical protein